jgi:hypothetical protein
MKEPKIYKSIWQVVVLSSEPVSQGTSFEEVIYQIDEGDCLGSYGLRETQAIEGTQAVAKACEDVGNDITFFARLWQDEEAAGH